MKKIIDKCYEAVEDMYGSCLDIHSIKADVTFNSEFDRVIDQYLKKVELYAMVKDTHDSFIRKNYLSFIKVGSNSYTVCYPVFDKCSDTGCADAYTQEKFNDIIKMLIAYDKKELDQ